MIHLSVAIGRFVEALFYAILRVAGVVTIAVVGTAFAGFLPPERRRSAPRRHR